VKTFSLKIIQKKLSDKDCQANSSTAVIIDPEQLKCKTYIHKKCIFFNISSLFF